MQASLITLDHKVKPYWTGHALAAYAGAVASKPNLRQVIGLRLQKARENTGLSQPDVAQRFGIKSYKTVSAWETGRGDPGIYRLRSLAKLYDVGADDLLMLEIEVSATRHVKDIALFGQEALIDDDEPPTKRKRKTGK